MMGEVPLLTSSLYRVQGSPYTGFRHSEALPEAGKGEMPTDGVLAGVAGLMGKFVLPPLLPRRLPFF